LDRGYRTSFAIVDLCALYSTRSMCVFDLTALPARRK
jgi:hypothetical protein